MEELKYLGFYDNGNKQNQKKTDELIARVDSLLDDDSNNNDDDNINNDDDDDDRNNIVHTAVAKRISNCERNSNGCWCAFCDERIAYLND